jgi:P4 family phage/plasmid primase-like protien
MNLNEFLKSRLTKDKTIITNTRIPDKDGGGKGGGSYHVTDADLDPFYNTYFRTVFDALDPQLEYLTETQREIGPLAIDVDFRYKVPTRAYTAQHVEDFVVTVAEEIYEMYPDVGNIAVHVMEKTKINVVGEVIKDGIHFIVALNLHKVCKEMLRRRLLARLDEIWAELSQCLTNDWDSVLDHKVMVGATAWQMIGSRKPRHEAYRHTYTFNAVCDKVVAVSRSTAAQMTLQFMPQLSVRYQKHPTPELGEAFEQEFTELKTGQVRKKAAPAASATSLAKMTCEADVDKALALVFDNTDAYTIRETHEYTMLLPESYYNPYDKWIRVGFALKNTSLSLFPSFIKFSSKSPSFHYGKVGELHDLWMSWPKGALTNRSIMYWARNSNPEGYVQLNKETLGHHIEHILSLKDITEYDIAVLLKHQYKDQFVCVNVKNKVWYEYNAQRWMETDSGTTLRNKISEHDGLHGIFRHKLMDVMREFNALDQVTDHEAWLNAKKRVNKVNDLLTDLKRTDKKGNIMKEASHLFYEPEFLQKLDSKAHILCCTNGVFDFEEGKFRQGLPEDYTSKCTKIPYEADMPAELVAEINTFFDELFPSPELREYMLDHLASTLIGKNTNQTFNIYIGKGRNGKSVLVDLMSKVLGEYKATVPVSLITQKRPGIGASSSEVAQLFGIRYAVMQEPSNGDHINDGIMKELTGGDTIQARSLYQNSFTFTPMMKLVVLTNQELGINSTDDGTWRRIRMCDFEAHFCETPVKGDPARPYQFKVDKFIDKKFDKWKTVLLAMLVERAKKTNGIVADCEKVMAKSTKYRKEQDHFSEFIKFCIQVAPKGTVKQSDMVETFTEWWKTETGSKEKCPSPKELSRYMNRVFGDKVEASQGKQAYWRGIVLVKPQEAEPDGI